MKLYRKVDNCGPVPYPDQGGRYLTTETVSGEEWEPLVHLGFVELVVGEEVILVEVVESAPVSEPPAADPVVELQPEPVNAEVPEVDPNPMTGRAPVKTVKSVSDIIMEAAENDTDGPATVIEGAFAAQKQGRGRGGRPPKVKPPEDE